jgi:hypothetical protein
MALETSASLLEFSSDDSREDEEQQPMSSSKRKKKEQEKEDEFIRRYMEELEQERQAFLDKWKQENERRPAGVSTNPRSSSSSTNLSESSRSKSKSSWISTWLANTEVFLCNMPLTIGAVGLGWVTQGVVWFKFMEEMGDACVPRRFNSAACTYPEFPGCFECDTSDELYLAAISFHYLCHGVGAFCCLLFLLKTVLAWQVVVDELKNPATATPMGVVCITLVCVFAGRGVIGECITIATSIFHCALAFWFLYTAIFQFRLLPDPGWFPNTVGIRYDLKRVFVAAVAFDHRAHRLPIRSSPSHTRTPVMQRSRHGSTFL